MTCLCERLGTQWRFSSTKSAKRFQIQTIPLWHFNLDKLFGQASRWINFYGTYTDHVTQDVMWLKDKRVEGQKLINTELSTSHASHVPCDEGTCGDRSSLKNSCFFQLPKLILFKVSVDTDTFFRIITWHNSREDATKLIADTILFPLMHHSSYYTYLMMQCLWEVR